MTKDETSEVVAANIRRLRLSRGLSLPDLSRELSKGSFKVSAVALGRLERGERKATVDDLTAIAVVLGVSPAELLDPALSEVTLTGVPEGLVQEEIWWWLTGTPLTQERMIRKWQLRISSQAATLNQLLALPGRGDDEVQEKVAILQEDIRFAESRVNFWEERTSKR